MRINIYAHLTSFEKNKMLLRFVAMNIFSMLDTDYSHLFCEKQQPQRE